MDANGSRLAKLGGKTRNWNLQQVIQIGHIIAALTFLPEPFIADFAGNGIAPFKPWNCPILDIVAATIEVVFGRLSRLPHI
jgi:hypothetical protein